MDFFNLDIERAILSTFLFDNIEIENTNLEKNDFYHPFHQKVFDYIKKILEKNGFVDEIILKNELEKNNEEFDEILMSEIITTAPLVNIKDYANIIKELSLKRKLNKILNLTKIELNKNDILTTVNKIKEELNNIEKNTPNSFNLSSFREVEDKEIEFILKYFLPIPKKAVTLLSARGGAGKSWLVLQLALKYLHENPDSKVFAWLSEDPLFTTKARAKKILNDVLIKQDNNVNNYLNFKYLGSETRPFHFVEYNYKNKQINPLFYKLKNTLKDFDFIILDPLIAFFGGDENNNSQAREFMNLLTEWADKENKAILVVHHNNKSTTGGIRGASAFVDAVRLHYEVLTKQNDNENENPLPDGYRIIKIQKDNWGVEKILGKKEIDIQIFKNETIQITYNNTNSIDKIDTADKKKTYNNLLKSLKDD